MTAKENCMQRDAHLLNLARRRTTRCLVFFGLFANSVCPAAATCAISTAEHWCSTEPAVISVNKNGQIADVTRVAVHGVTKEFLNDHTIILPAGWNVIVRNNGLYQAQPGSGAVHDTVIQEPYHKPASSK